MEKRKPYQAIWKELSADKAMVFVSGPRQSGKTTLARMIAAGHGTSVYFNWDDLRDKARFFEDPYFFEAVPRKGQSVPLVILDEIHKHRKWKNYLKGVYDRFHETMRFLVAGSGRLDLYRGTGDSLAGRYLLFHLWPFTVAELGGSSLDFQEFFRNPLRPCPERRGEFEKIWSRLSRLSGFPEPYLSGREASYRRWSGTYARQLIREDVRDLAGVRSVEEAETLYALLPSKVGSPLSVPSLAGDIGVSYNSIRGWLSAFEKLYMTIGVPAWARRISRAVVKERKIYLLDYPRIVDPAARFEGMVAVELWRAVTAWNDLGRGSFSLHFVRNKEHEEVDFLIADGNRPVLLVEAKRSDMNPSKPLRKFQAALGVPAVQLVEEADGHTVRSNGPHSILVAPAAAWLAQLP